MSINIYFTLLRFYLYHLVLNVDSVQKDLIMDGRFLCLTVKSVFYIIDLYLFIVINDFTCICSLNVCNVFTVYYSMTCFTINVMLFLASLDPVLLSLQLLLYKVSYTYMYSRYIIYNHYL